jgi:hypothetical protein
VCVLVQKNEGKSTETHSHTVGKNSLSSFFFQNLFN